MNERIMCVAEMFWFDRHGKKGPGRPRTSYLSSQKKWLDPTANENAIIQLQVSASSFKNEMAQHDRRRPDGHGN